MHVHRHKAIVALMEEKVDQDAGTVIAAMLEASRGFERDVSDGERARAVVVLVQSMTSSLRS